MAFRHFTVTLLATETRAIATHLPVSYVRAEGESGNAIMYWGQTGLTTEDYGGSIPATSVAGFLIVGAFPHGILNLDELYFLGTTDDVVHLTVVTP